MTEVFAPCLTLYEIYARYRELAILLPTHGPLLKCDCHNEAVGGWQAVDLDLSRTTFIELDRRVITIARRRWPQVCVVEGDIRQLPFESNHFAGLLDLSTIDHVFPAEANGVLTEYARVLQPNGLLVQVLWCTTEPTDWVRDWGGPQYFLCQSDLNYSAFQIKYQRPFHQVGPIYLQEIIATRK
jgi:SAM-dependent methyltransferase